MTNLKTILKAHSKENVLNVKCRKKLDFLWVESTINLNQLDGLIQILFFLNEQKVKLTEATPIQEIECTIEIIDKILKCPNAIHAIKIIKKKTIEELIFLNFDDEQISKIWKMVLFDTKIIRLKQI